LRKFTATLNLQANWGIIQGGGKKFREILSKLRGETHWEKGSATGKYEISSGIRAEKRNPGKRSRSVAQHLFWGGMRGNILKSRRM